MHLTAPPWLVLVLGAIGLVFGVAVIVFRRGFYRFFAAEQRRSLGKVGKVVADRTKPLHFIPVGVVFAGIGVLLIAVVVTTYAD